MHTNETRKPVQSQGWPAFVTHNGMILPYSNPEQRADAAELGFDYSKWFKERLGGECDPSEPRVYCMNPIFVQNNEYLFRSLGFKIPAPFVPGIPGAA